MRATLTVGMATYDDFDGVYFTIQALRLYHPAIHEIIVVDNRPESPDGQMTGRFVRGSVANGRYIPFADVIGTAAPRDRVFREATGDIVCCVDSHVLLHPGAIEHLLAYFETRPASKDLVSGPMHYDGGGFATHFQDQWRAQMWGVWDRAWECPCGELFSVVGGQHPDGREQLLFQPIFGERTARHFLTACPKCHRDYPRDLGYSGHEQPLTAAGYRCDLADPFDIPAMGLGLFACRREAWPGFNPEFRGFGGEEFYIHEKCRRAGGRCVCIPQLGWTHRFGRPHDMPYPNTMWDRVRNYVIGHRELGLSLDRLTEHFLTNGTFPKREWDLLLSSDPPPEWPHPGGRPPIVSQPQLSQGPQAAPAAAPPAQALNFSISTAAAAAEPTRSQKPKTLADASSIEDAYLLAASTTSDINEHCPTLREWAAKCGDVTEFGVRYGVSTVALAAGAKRLTSYDLVRQGDVTHIERLAGDRFRFITGDSLTADIEPTDLLFIDTRHNATQLRAELARHAPKVRRAIALHDTQIYGERGDDGAEGLLVALRDFLAANPQWFIAHHASHNFGLTIVSKHDGDRPQTAIADQAAAAIPRKTAPDHGPGTELALILKSLGIEPQSSCDCKGKQAQMNVWGVAGCRANLNTIIGWMRDGAGRWNWTDRFAAAAKAVTTGLAFQVNWLDPFPDIIEQAIQRAEQDQRAAQ
jgi:hypothetical protein